MTSRKPIEIVDREFQWKELLDIQKSGRPELCFVLGRRRAGKSFVLSKFATAVKGVYYQASSRTENEQLLNLSQVIGKAFGDSSLQRGVAFPTWEALLEGRRLHITFTLRQGGELIRVISARDMHRKERASYEQATKDNT
jgi:AAA+ ATPase superfamily predicted ATPase